MPTAEEFVRAASERLAMLERAIESMTAKGELSSPILPLLRERAEVARSDVRLARTLVEDATEAS